MPPLLYLADIRLTFGGAPLFKGASLTIDPRDRIALVGRNGSGKSTLLRIAAGSVEADTGDRFVSPGTRVSYLPQEPDLSGFKTVGDYVLTDLPLGLDQHEIVRELNELGLSPDLICETLSGGEARRAAIARALAGAPDILLLDEPTNHLDLPAIAKLEDRLATTRAALVLISHDRKFLERLSTKTVWIDRGETRTTGVGFSRFESWRDKVLEEEEIARHKLDRKIVSEEHWVRYGVTARRRRNVRRMRELDTMRTERREAHLATGKVKFSLNEGKGSGKRVIVAENLSKEFDGRAVVQDFSIEISRGDRVGFVGPNGAGKTTLINLLSGALTPDKGIVRLGTHLETVSLDQRRASLEPDMRVADAITDGRGDWVTIAGEKRHAATYLKDFLFAPEQWRAPVRSLSGGERGRLALAAALAKPSNLLILDEPTNDLDLETLDLLEELLAGYSGTLLLVSHDRSFLDRTVTSVVAPDTRSPEGRWCEYVGGYSDMLSFVKPESSLPPWKAGASLHKKTPVVLKPTTAKLSYKEQYALERLPDRIAGLEEIIAELKLKLDDQNLYERDRHAFEKAVKTLDIAQNSLCAAEEEWLVLEVKRESLEGR